jgi:hypothetical protein
MMHNRNNPSEYSVWDRGESFDPNPATAAELDRIEKYLIAASLQTARRRIEEQKGCHHPDLYPHVAEVEMEAHETRMREVARFMHDVRTGLPF